MNMSNAGADAAPWPGEAATPPAAPPPAEAHKRPGIKAMWVGVSLEYIEFAVFFVVYFVARWHNPQAFQQGATRLWTIGGLCVTAVMVTGGYLLTRAIASTRAGNQVWGQRWLALALLTGLIYPVLKVLEWQWNLAHGINASAGVFVVVYYYITINHFIHASWGLMGMAWGLVRFRYGGYTADDHRGLEAIATYWHATDMVWLMIFALFYAFA
jgi:cytochrome c oxidase subunit 3